MNFEDMPSTSDPEFVVKVGLIGITNPALIQTRIIGYNDGGA